MSVADPLGTLRRAHDIGLGKLKLLSGAVSGLNKGSNPAALGALKEVLLFFDGELRVHFRHEEEVLFPALERVIGREGPIAAMLDEHQSVWRAVDALREKTAQLENTAEENRGDIAHEIELVGTHIVGLLGSHIDKENGMLFPMAEQTLSATAIREIAERMKAVEEAA
ncbi:MAG: hemerythrin domain-containing protein [Dehalococcoidia bacterium]